MPGDHQLRDPICPASFVDTLAGVFGPPLRAGNTIQWASAAGPVKATVHTADALSDDGRHLQGAITVVQELRLPSPGLANTVTARHNREPGLGAAFAVADRPDTVKVVSRVSWYRDEEDIRDKLGLTLAVAVLCNMTSSLDYGAGRRLPSLPHHDQPSRWSEPDPVTLAREFDRHGVEVWVGGGRLLARLRFAQGDIPATEDSSDSILVVSTQCVHSSLGNGLAVEAGFCPGLPAELLSMLASRLNRMEADSIAGPPLLGAWTIAHGRKRLCFRSFWPNVGYIPGLLDCIASWQVERLRLVKDVLIAGPRCVA